MKIEPVSKIQEAPATNTTRDQRPLGPPPTNPLLASKKSLSPSTLQTAAKRLSNTPVPSRNNSAENSSYFTLSNRTRSSRN
jgi:hypothetical protein